MKKAIEFFDYYQHKPMILLTASVLGFLKLIVEKYLFNDWQFLYALFVLVLLDTSLGIWRNLKTKTLSSRGFAGFFEKLGLYASFLIVTHVLITFTVSGKSIGVFAWIDSVFYSAIMVREAISILENIGAIKPDLIPAWILAYLKKFDASGKLSDLQNPNQDGNNS